MRKDRVLEEKRQFAQRVLEGDQVAIRRLIKDKRLKEERKLRAMLNNNELSYLDDSELIPFISFFSELFEGEQSSENQSEFLEKYDFLSIDDFNDYSTIRKTLYPVKYLHSLDFVSKREDYINYRLSLEDRIYSAMNNTPSNYFLFSHYMKTHTVAYRTFKRLFSITYKQFMQEFSTYIIDRKENLDTFRIRCDRANSLSDSQIARRKRFIEKYESKRDD